MPYVKSIPIRTTVNRSLAYILNKDKTDGLLYTASINCMTNAKDAYLAMKSVYEHYAGEKYNAPLPIKGKGSVKAIHYIQSFDPQDNVPPELAHRIAKAFAKKTFGDDCQVVIATHCDRNHIHNHLIINTYSLSGEKFNDNQTTLKRIREYSDRVCLAYGIQPYDKSKGKGRTMAYNEWEHKQRGTSWKQQIRLEIDNLIGSVKNLDELLYELELWGYEVRKGKYISIKAPGQKRSIRTKTLGEDYTAESLASRILWRDIGAGVALSDYEPSQLRDAYQQVIGDAMQLAANGSKIQHRRDNQLPYSPQNDMDVYKLSAQLAIINRDRIHSIGELEGKIEALKAEYENARQQVNTLTSQHERLATLLQQAETYFALMDKPMLTETEQLKLNFCRQTLQNNNINSRSDMEHLQAVQREMGKKMAALKENFKSCQQLYEVYSDIAKTYYDISKGDYVSKLVEEECRKKEQEAQRKKNKAI